MRLRSRTTAEEGHDCRASAYLSLIGIPEDRLFSPVL